ncbi:hypothetical protein VTJ83DRAFT_3615 [Remersonia thermophila]|uniref:Glutamine synthetase n=1 Tax=Remersonia thermophila TaxID=72144 RepID=A0ABR4DGS7_9PEZI
MASWIGMRGTATPAQVDAVARAIRNTPIIDHHAHPLLKLEALAKKPLLAITTEAAGDAMDSATSSLPHLRAVRQLAAALGCGYSWESVVVAIEERRLEGLEDWTAACLDGIETLLLDDGLDDEDDANPLSWHDDYTRSRCKRIVRIEKVAADVLRRLGASRDRKGDPFDEWLRDFDAEIRKAIDDPDVAGFKSVVGYRTGLDITDWPADVSEAHARADFRDIVDTGNLRSFKRLQTKSLNDLVVHRVARLIRDSPSRPKKPLQFHTGLGDNDLVLAKASPSHLQPFIRLYPTVPIVLLHAGYPFTRETGYLAAVYENVYADIGEVFPFVSHDGQERLVREILELCPWTKILWSTDGHWFPETYLLAIKQMREVFETVLCDYVRKGHIGWQAAINLVRDVLFRNARKLYNLDIDFAELDAETGPSPASYQSDAELLQAFLKDQPAPDFVRIFWSDFTATQRMRMIPFRRFEWLLNEGLSTDIGIATAVFALTQNDHVLPGVHPTGEYRLHPDFSSLKKGPIEGHISMAGEFRHPSGAQVPYCPRSVLQRAVEYGAQNNLSFRIGFEIEFLLVERNALLGANPGGAAAATPSQYSILTTDGHAWSVSRCFANPRVATLLRDMVAALADAGIYAQQLHAESATGQFELVLPPYPPVEAADTLLHARDIMSSLATAAGFKLTLHPKPLPYACGTASHMHMSVAPIRPAPRARRKSSVSAAAAAAAAAGAVVDPTATTEVVISSPAEAHESFYAGVLKHLRAITAFTYPSPASYERCSDSTWSGGRWVSWGTQNRETALRRIEGSHWEVRCLDGLANPYLAVAAVLFAGTKGYSDGEPLAWGDCEIDPSKLTENDRAELGVTQMLPGSVAEALEALKQDEELVEMMGPELVERYAAVKDMELAFLGKMSGEERRRWLMERY